MVCLVMFFALVAVAAGCSKVDQALESDARGYLCGACTNRFSTPENVFADQCPRCKSGDLLEVLGYVCRHDQHVTLGPRSKGAIECGQCGRPVSSIKLPTAAELQAWGANRQSKSEVSSSP
jgi:DNA-directed RNA polymerase subunit RPC12/RpoP